MALKKRRRKEKCLFSEDALKAALAKIRADPEKSRILLECQRIRPLPTVKSGK